MARNFDLNVAPGNQSWSKSINETVVGSHNVIFTGYSLAKGMGPGKYISSEIFNVGGYDWAVYFYPDGNHPEDLSAYISVFVALASEGTNVRAMFEIMLMDQSGKGNHIVFRHFDSELDGRPGPRTLQSRGSMSGYRQFYRKSIFESSNFLKNDSFEMRCKVGVIKSRVEGTRTNYIEIPPSNIKNDFKYLLDSGFEADITFSLANQKFKAHKLILSAYSSFFKAQFLEYPDLHEVEIVDIDPAVFKLMLEYMYTSEFTYPTSNSTLTTNTIHHLLSAANRYDLDKLRLLCEAKLSERINIDNVATTLCLAEQNRCSQLKALCLKFTVNNLSGA